MSVENQRGMVVSGALLSGAVLLASLIGPWVGLPSPYELDVSFMLTGPSGTHWLGADELGRDLLSRTVHAARTSLLVAVTAASIGLTLGTLIGMMAAFLGGVADVTLMRLMDLLFSFPAMLLAIVLMASLGTSIFNAMLAIGLVFIPGFARLARAAAARVLRETFTEAALALGAHPARILLWHVLPNIGGVMLAHTLSALSYGILLESSLSFLGLGAPPTEPSWGTMLNTGRGFMSQAPLLSIVPGAAIFLTVFGFTLLGDGLREAYGARVQHR